jgi:hypothetical protein
VASYFDHVAIHCEHDISEEEIVKLLQEADAAVAADPG